jgi:threonine/homoserine/homoserine lactone efflux protein
MLLEAIGGLLPSAVGVALSPIPIIAVVVMLGTPRARTNGPAFALGWVAGLVVVSVVVVVLAGGADDPDSATSTGVDWAQVGIGVLFLALAGRQWRRRPRDGTQAEMPSWMSSVDHFGAAKALGLGVVLSAVNPKNLALTAAAAASIAQAGVDAGDEVVAIAVFVGLASVTVVGSVVAYLVAPSRVSGALSSLKDVMATHNAVIMVVIFLVLGAKVLGEGLGGIGR